MACASRYVGNGGSHCGSRCVGNDMWLRYGVHYGALRLCVTVRHCVRRGPSCRPPPAIFGPCLLWPNGWMDQDATCYGGRPRPRPHYVRWGPSLNISCTFHYVPRDSKEQYNADCLANGDPAPIRQKGHSSPPLFGPCLLWPNGWMDQ